MGNTGSSKTNPSTPTSGTRGPTPASTTTSPSHSPPSMGTEATGRLVEEEKVSLAAESNTISITSGVTTPRRRQAKSYTNSTSIAPITPPTSAVSGLGLVESTPDSASVRLSSEDIKLLRSWKHLYDIEVQGYLQQTIGSYYDAQKDGMDASKYLIEAYRLKLYESRSREQKLHAQLLASQSALVRFDNWVTTLLARVPDDQGQEQRKLFENLRPDPLLLQPIPMPTVTTAQEHEMIARAERQMNRSMKPKVNVFQSAVPVPNLFSRSHSRSSSEYKQGSKSPAAKQLFPSSPSRIQQKSSTQANTPNLHAVSSGSYSSPSTSVSSSSYNTPNLSSTSPSLAIERPSVSPPSSFQSGLNKSQVFSALRQQHSARQPQLQVDVQNVFADDQIIEVITEAVPSTDAKWDQIVVASTDGNRTPTRNHSSLLYDQSDPSSPTNLSLISASSNKMLPPAPAFAQPSPTQRGSLFFSPSDPFRPNPMTNSPSRIIPGHTPEKRRPRRKTLDGGSGDGRGEKGKFIRYDDEVDQLVEASQHYRSLSQAINTVQLDDEDESYERAHQRHSSAPVTPSRGTLTKTIPFQSIEDCELVQNPFHPVHLFVTPLKELETPPSPRVLAARRASIERVTSFKKRLAEAEAEVAIETSSTASSSVRVVLGHEQSKSHTKSKSFSHSTARDLSLSESKSDSDQESKYSDDEKDGRHSTTHADSLMPSKQPSKESLIRLVDGSEQDGDIVVMTARTLVNDEVKPQDEPLVEQPNPLFNAHAFDTTDEMTGVITSSHGSRDQKAISFTLSDPNEMKYAELPDMRSASSTSAIFYLPPLVASTRSLTESVSSSTNLDDITILMEAVQPTDGPSAAFAAESNRQLTPPMDAVPTPHNELTSVSDVTEPIRINSGDQSHQTNEPQVTSIPPRSLSQSVPIPPTISINSTHIYLTASLPLSPTSSASTLSPSTSDSSIPSVSSPQLLDIHTRTPLTSPTVKRRLQFHAAPVHALDSPITIDGINRSVGHTTNQSPC